MLILIQGIERAWNPPYPRQRFNNTLRKELSQRAALIGASPEVIIEAGARNIRAAGLTPSQLAAVLVAYGKAIDRTMYLGIAVFGSVMLVAWEMGFKNLKEVERQKELKNHSTSEEGMGASSDVKPVEQVRTCAGGSGSRVRIMAGSKAPSSPTSPSRALNESKMKLYT